MWCCPCCAVLCWVQVSEVATLFDDDGILVRFMNSDVQGNSVRWAGPGVGRGRRGAGASCRHCSRWVRGRGVRACTHGWSAVFDDDGILVRFMNFDVQGNSVR